VLSGERFYAAVVSASLAPGACPGAAGAGREHFTGDDELVFAGEAGRYLDGSALRRRHARAHERAGCASCASATRANGLLEGAKPPWRGWLRCAEGWRTGSTLVVAVSMVAMAG